MWGKVLGLSFGFLFGRWFGALLGLYLGHRLDRYVRQGTEQSGGTGRFFSASALRDRQAVFFHATFSVMGHIAKSNGRVNEGHIQAANLIMAHMGLKGDQKAEAQAAFREGKEADFALTQTLKDFKRSVFGRRQILQMFLEIQIQAAFSDGILSNEEKELLRTVGKALGFNSQSVDGILKRWEAEYRFHQEQQQRGQGQRQAPTQSALDNAYEILGVSTDTSAPEVKKAYKKLMNQNHPDKLLSKGLPPEMMDLAKRKTQDIQAAYDLVRSRA